MLSAEFGTENEKEGYVKLLAPPLSLSYSAQTAQVQQASGSVVSVLYPDHLNPNAPAPLIGFIRFRLIPLFRFFPLVPPYLCPSGEYSSLCWNRNGRYQWVSRAKFKELHFKTGIYFFFIFCFHIVTFSFLLAQPPDTVVLDRLQGDIERPSVSTTVLPVDPYQFRDGIVPDEDIAGLRRRNKGKALAKYQLRQNNVCARHCSTFALTIMPTLAYFGLAQINGGAHRGCKECRGSRSSARKSSDLF